MNLNQRASLRFEPGSVFVGGLGLFGHHTILKIKDLLEQNTCKYLIVKPDDVEDETIDSVDNLVSTLFDSCSLGSDFKELLLL